MTATIELCGERIPVVAQRHPRIIRCLGAYLDSLIDDMRDIDGPGLVEALDENAYDALCVLLPKSKDDVGFEARVPRHRFEGFVSQEAMDADDYDPDKDEWAPTIPELETAFQTVVEVNRLTVLRPKLALRAFMRWAGLDEAVVALATGSHSMTTASSPSPQDGSAQSTSSGPSAPTDPLTVNRSASPFPVFSG